MATATLTSKGQITLPKEVRERLNVDTGDEIDFVVTSRGDIVVRAASRDIWELKGSLKRPRRRPVSVEAMNEAILDEHSRKR